MAKKLLITKYQYIQAYKDIWYIDFHAFKHLTNNKNMFIETLKTKLLDFTIFSGQMLYAKSIATVYISLTNRIISLKNITYATE